MRKQSEHPLPRTLLGPLSIILGFLIAELPNTTFLIPLKVVLIAALAWFIVNNVKAADCTSVVRPLLQRFNTRARQLAAVSNLLLGVISEGIPSTSWWAFALKVVAVVGIACGSWWVSSAEGSYAQANRMLLSMLPVEAILRGLCESLAQQVRSRAIRARVMHLSPTGYLLHVGAGITLSPSELPVFLSDHLVANEGPVGQALASNRTFELRTSEKARHMPFGTLHGGSPDAICRPLRHCGATFAVLVIDCADEAAAHQFLDQSTIEMVEADARVIEECLDENLVDELRRRPLVETFGPK